jgi:hypothetical protein
MLFTFSYRSPIVEQKSHFCNLPYFARLTGVEKWWNGWELGRVDGD